MDMLDDLIKFEIAKFEQTVAQIRRVSNYDLARDLLKLARSCENTINEISKEQVTCRRLNKKTQKLSELYRELCENITTLEQYITFASLLDN